MAEYDRGQLLGYLLGALDAEEEQAIDEQVERDPELRQELARLRSSLRPLRAAQTRHEPPAGLAGRTCGIIALLAGPPVAEAPRPKPRPRVSRMSPAAVPPADSAAWSWTDMAVALTVLVLAALAILPAVQSARNRARLAACQDNLRQIGVQYAQFTHRFPSELPNALPREPAALAGFGPAAPALHGPSQGQNVLLGDGRVLLICTGSRLVSGDQWPGFDVRSDLLSPAPSGPPVVFVNDRR